MGSRAMKGRKGTKVKNKKVIVLSVLGLMVAFIAAGVFGVVTLCNSWLEDLPDYQNADAYNTAQPTMVYASDGTTLLAEFQLENREPVALDQISEYVLEGHRCHRGRALLHPRRRRLPRRRPRTREQPHGRRAGGRFHHHAAVRAQHHPRPTRCDDISFKRKVREMYISQQAGGAVLQRRDPAHVPQHHQLRLGRLRHRGCLRSVTSRRTPTDLTLNEAATLVGIPQSPTYNNPIDYPDNCLDAPQHRARPHGVQWRSSRQEEADAVKAEPIELNPYRALHRPASWPTPTSRATCATS